MAAGKTLTSWPSLQTGIRNAGGDCRDEQVFRCSRPGFDRVTSRKPDDLDAFDEQLVKSFATGPRPGIIVIINAVEDRNMALGFLRGAAAGAAGTTALNAATYLDMAVRGRGSSRAPQNLVEAVANRADVKIPGQGDERDNRLAGLGPLAGIGVGVMVGAAAGLVLGGLRKRGISVPAPVPVVLIGAAAMALSDVPLKQFGISDPSAWAAADWAADAVPHLLYGLVTYAAIQAAGEL